MSKFTSGERYWLGQGPLTKEEQNRKFKYVKKYGKLDNAHNRKHYVARLRKRREINRYLKGKEEAATDPTNPWQVVYGSVQLGGTVTFIHTSDGAVQADGSYKKDLYLHMVITIAANEIYYLEEVYFDGYTVAWDTTLTTRPSGVVNATGIFAGLVKMQVNYGSDGQSALSQAVADIPSKWTSNHRQRGHAHVYLRLVHNEVVFKNGVPDITFRVTGGYGVVDPRTPTPAPGAQNAAMILYDYMTNSRFGMKMSASDFNATRRNQAITDCEDLIALAAGGTENRYLLSAHFGVDEAPGALVEDMLASMAGRIVYSAGAYSIYAGKAKSSVMTITESMILSDIQVMTKAPRSESFNSVRGTFVSVSNFFEESDFPAVTNSTYVTQDSSVEIYEDLSFGMVTSASRCQRLAKIELEQIRQGITVEFTATMAAYQAEPGEWVSVTFSEFGWSAKVFEVVRSALQIEDGPDGAPRFTVRLLLRETASAVYDWNTGNETTFDVAPNTTLPNPFVVADPTALTLASGTAHLYIRSDGTVFTRLYVSWVLASDAFVQNGGYYELQFKRTADSSWQDAGDVPGSSSNYYILDVEDGSAYDVRIRSVSAVGSRGNWVTTSNHSVVGKTEAPSDVTIVSAVIEGFTVKLSWSAVTDLDVREYEIRYGTSSQSWDIVAATAVKVRATAHIFRSLPAGTTRFQIKALDTTGNYSTNARTCDLVVSAPGSPMNPSISQIDNNVLIRWEPPLSGTFPVAYYKVIRQDATAFLDLGRASGTFLTYVELLSGEYLYRISAVDTAGNEGPAQVIGAPIYSPPDFVLRSSQLVSLAGATLTNAAYESATFSIEASANTEETWEDHFVNNGFTTFQNFIDFPYSYYLEPLTGASGTATFTTTTGSVWFPVDSTQTWEEHFTDNGFDDTQDFIDAGYQYYFQPNNTLTGTVEVTVDLTEVLPQTVVGFDYVAFGSGIYPTPQISWRRTVGDPWTAGPPNSKRATPSNYRYMKLTLTIAAENSLDWCVVNAVTLSVNVKEITDSNTTAVNSGDAGGTTITFGKSFLDVSSIVVTPQGTTELKPVVDFNDVANPTTFKVLLFNSAGARASGTVRWTARGVQAVL